MPHEMLAKFFTKTYSEQTDFYPEMNNSLMKKNIKEYVAFIRIMYEGFIFFNVFFHQRIIHFAIKGGLFSVSLCEKFSKDFMGHILHIK